MQLMQAAHLLVLLNCLLLGLSNDAFKFMKTSLHIREAQTGILLFPADALQLLLTMFLSDAGTLLPLLDTLREDLIDPAVDACRLTSVKVKNVFNLHDYIHGDKALLLNNKRAKLTKSKSISLYFCVKI